MFLVRTNGKGKSVSGDDDRADVLVRDCRTATCLRGRWSGAARSLASAEYNDRTWRLCDIIVGRRRLA
jgi:hypothetical protein